MGSDLHSLAWNNILSGFCTFLQALFTQRNKLVGEHDIPLNNIEAIYQGIIPYYTFQCENYY